MGWSFPALAPVTCWPCPSGHLTGGDSESSRIWNLLRQRRKKVLVAQSCLIHCHPWTVACQTPLSIEFYSKDTEWVAMPFSRGSSWPRERTWVSCMARRLFTIWATKAESINKIVLPHFPVVQNQTLFCHQLHQNQNGFLLWTFVQSSWTSL